MLKYCFYDIFVYKTFVYDLKVLIFFKIREIIEFNVESVIKVRQTYLHLR